ncbi:hypothetical protein OW763_13970 [Clostridium aestuarii]|uniref:DUF4083 domain-containing protein n=1 Tax=Clostridium aestuarii TaxID=338193 RepID=A0ABT4D463_9CLOT|nr:hypothetical protein [Clostridium aestuarii]MCY6485437.1 hypothetical protein [Clostridium aestuarii]
MGNPSNQIMTTFFLHLILLFILIGIGFYGFVLFVKLARRGIKALDIYIDKNSKDISEQ